MSDWYYSVVWHACNPIFWASSRPTVLGAEHTRRDGPFIIAATHQSPYDVPLMMRHSARALDFVSIVEVFRKPLVGWFYGSMNAFPLDRSRRDPATVRIILNRLERGRVIAMFPEGGFRRGKDSVIHTHRIQPGIGRLAQLANVPIVPCVILNSSTYSHVRSWMPIRRTWYGIIFGPPIPAGADANQIERHLVAEFIRLHAALTLPPNQRQNFR